MRKVPSHSTQQGGNRMSGKETDLTLPQPRSPVAGLMLTPKWAQAPKSMPLTQHLVNIKNWPGFLHSVQIPITKISQKKGKISEYLYPAVPPTGFRPERDTWRGDGVGMDLEAEAGIPAQHLPAASCESWPSACPLSGLRVPSRNKRAWLNKGHKEPPQTFHHWLSFLDTRS